MGSDIDDQPATIVNNIFKSRLTDGNLKEKIHKFCRPQGAGPVCMKRS